MSVSLHIVELAERSDTGRVRDHNEDRSYVSAHVVAVADGMGGALAGEVASQMAVEAIEGISAPADPLAIKAAIENANRAIRRMAAQDPSKAGMGTTITAATVSGREVDIVHVGDSRAYRWSGDTLEQLTHDHSVVAELVRRGSLSPAEAENHPHRNVITRALGAESEVTVDTYRHPVDEDDVLLLCSDGLYGEVSDADIAEELRRATSLEEGAAALVARANANGGADNITVVLARLGSGPATEATSATLSSDTQEIPVEEPVTVRGGRPDRATKRIAGNPSPGDFGTPAAPPMLERAETRKRRRLGLWLVMAVAVAGIVVGGIAWFEARSYALAKGPGDTVWVDRGIAIGPLSTRRNWEDTGVPATGDIALGGIGGIGATVLKAAQLVWTRGLPTVTIPSADVPTGQVPGLAPATRSPAPGTPARTTPDTAPTATTPTVTTP